jgi:hypothetical protein
MKAQHQRWHIFVDRPIQGALLLRASVYCAICLTMQQLIVCLFVLLTSTTADMNTNGARLWWHIQLSIVASLAILPILLLDILKLSHRWVGPVFRLRASMHALSVGESIPPIRFRDGDYWQDLASDVNVVAAELIKYRASSRKDALVATVPLPNTHEICCASHRETGVVTGDSFPCFGSPSGVGSNTVPTPLR